MSSNTEIPLAPLTEFVENALRILVESTDQTAFDNQFNAFFGQNVSVTLNGEKLSRAQYKQQLFGVTFEEQSATINFLSSVAIPFGSVSSNPNIGVVGVFYEATITEKLRVLGGAAQRTISSSLNVTVEKNQSDTLIQRPGPLIQQQVIAVNQVTLSQAVPFHLPTSTGTTA